MLIAITYRSKSSGGRRAGFRLGSRPMRSKGGGVIDLRPRSWQTAWGYLELEGAVTGKSLRSVSPFWILTLPGFPRPVTAEGETGCGHRAGVRGALVAALRRTEWMLAANRKLGNIFLHQPQPVDCQTQKGRKRCPPSPPKIGKKGGLSFYFDDSSEAPDDKRIDGLNSGPLAAHLP